MNGGTIESLLGVAIAKLELAKRETLTVFEHLYPQMIADKDRRRWLNSLMLAHLATEYAAKGMLETAGMLNPEAKFDVRDFGFMATAQRTAETASHDAAKNKERVLLEECLLALQLARKSINGFRVELQDAYKLEPPLPENETVRMLDGLISKLEKWEGGAIRKALDEAEKGSGENLDRTPVEGAGSGARGGSHTPGPWHAYNCGIGWEVHSGAICSDQCAPINGGFRDTFIEADANLVAAAPDMLAALKLATAYFTDDGSELDYRDLCAAMAAAAAKAEPPATARPVADSAPTGEPKNKPEGQ